MGVKNSVIFLDEITFVEDWWRMIKARIDRKMFKNDAVMTMGSVSMEILKKRENFSGRRGYGKDLYFYPLDFNEYV